MTTPEIEKKIEEFVKLLGRVGDWVGDGHYCRHHPDDPAHGEKCYEFPQAILVRQALQEMYEMGKKAGIRDKENNEKFIRRGASDMKRRVLLFLEAKWHENPDTFKMKILRPELESLPITPNETV